MLQWHKMMQWPSHRLVLLVVVIIMVTCTAVIAQTQDAVYQITKHDLPTSLQPGQRLIAHISLRCINPGNPVVASPRVEATCGGMHFEPEEMQLVPWAYQPKATVAGGIIEQAFGLDIPLDCPSGDCVINFRITGKGHTAKLLDASGNPIGEALAWKCTVQSDPKALRVDRPADGKPFNVARSFPYLKFTGKNTEIDSKFGPVNLTLLHDEWVDVALNVANTSDKPLAIRCSTRNGKEEEFARLGLRGLETLWQQAIPVGSKNGKASFDAIQPVPAGVFQISAGETAQIWLSVHVPKDYKGEKSVSGNIKIEIVDGTPGKSLYVPITVNVLPQLLTKNPPVHCYTWNLLWPILPQDNPAWTEAHYTDLRTHGIDVYSLHGLRILPRPMANPDGTLKTLDFTNMDTAIELTKNDFKMYYVTVDIWEKTWVRTDLFGLDFPGPAYEKAFKSWIKAIVGRLKKHGIGYDRFIINPYDESIDQNCYTIAKWIKEADPKVRTVLDSVGSVDIINKFEKYNDVWIPHYSAYLDQSNKASIDLLRKEKKDLWMYWYTEGADEKHHQPTGHYMYAFWWAFQNDVNGVCYWAQQYYGDPWNRAETDALYDTSLVYPTEAGCIPSRRWQAWRQGWQDYCLLDLARNELRSRKDANGLAKLSSLVDKAVSIPADPANFEDARGYAKQVLAGR